MEDVVHEISDVQVPKITQKVTSLRNKFFAEAAIVGGSLYGAVQSGGLTIPVALLAAFQGISQLLIINRLRRTRRSSSGKFLRSRRGLNEFQSILSPVQPQLSFAPITQ